MTISTLIYKIKHFRSTLWYNMAVAHITGVFRFIWRFIKKRVLPACIEARIEQRSIKRNLHVMQNTAKNYDSSLPKGGKPPASLKKFSGS